MALVNGAMTLAEGSSCLLLSWCCRCAGVIMLDRPLPEMAKTCTLIRGDSTLGTNKRTVTRTDVTRLFYGELPL
jgi:hypothetical protein